MKSWQSGSLVWKGSFKFISLSPEVCLSQAATLEEHTGYCLLCGASPSARFRGYDNVSWSRLYRHHVHSVFFFCSLLEAASVSCPSQSKPQSKASFYAVKSQLNLSVYDRFCLLNLLFSLHERFISVYLTSETTGCGLMFCSLARLSFSAAVLSMTQSLSNWPRAVE